MLSACLFPQKVICSVGVSLVADGVSWLMTGTSQGVEAVPERVDALQGFLVISEYLTKQWAKSLQEELG